MLIGCFATMSQTVLRAATQPADHGYATTSTCHHISVAAHIVALADKDNDKVLLGKAMEYFRSGKYHEALLLFADLDSRYTLSPRTKAFFGVSAYYDGDYDTAVTQLTPMLSTPDAYPPAEMSVYWFCCAESLFHLHQYQSAIDHYEQYICICRPEERTEAFVKMGQCYIEMGLWRQALETLESASACSKAFDKEPQRTKRDNTIAALTDTCEQHMSSGTVFANTISMAPHADSSMKKTDNKNKKKKETTKK